MSFSTIYIAFHCYMKHSSNLSILALWHLHYTVCYCLFNGCQLIHNDPWHDRAGILQPLSNRSFALGRGPLVMTCKVRADSLFWHINGTWLNHGTRTMLQQRGFTFLGLHYLPNGTIRETVNIDARRNTNNTVLKCSGETPPHVASSTAVITIAG